MVWAAINWEGRSEICLKESGFKFNSDNYIEVLDQYLVPFIEDLKSKNPKYKLRSNGLVFLQDNAPCHRSSQTI